TKRAITACSCSNAVQGKRRRQIAGRLAKNFVNNATFGHFFSSDLDRSAGRRYLSRSLLRNFPRQFCIAAVRPSCTAVDLPQKTQPFRKSTGQTRRGRLRV